MTFRARLTLVAAAAVALAVILASAIVYVLVRDQLRGQVNDSLRTRADDIASPQGPPLHLEQGPDGTFYLDVKGPIGSLLEMERRPLRACDVVGARPQRVVDLPAQLIAHKDVDDRGREDDGQRDGGGGDECQPRAKGHVVRRA